MKISRKQLRKLILEAMYSPESAMHAARDRVQKDDPSGDFYARAINLIRTGKPENIEQGYSLLDMLGDFSAPLDKGSRETMQDHGIPPEMAQVIDAIINETMTMLSLSVAQIDLIRTDLKQQLIELYKNESSTGVGFDTSHDRDLSDDIYSEDLEYIKNEINHPGGEYNLMSIIKNTDSYKNHVPELYDWDASKHAISNYRLKLIKDSIVKKLDEIDDIGNLTDELHDEAAIKFINDGRFIVVNE
jgi:hypothetical protein